MFLFRVFAFVLIPCVAFGQSILDFYPLNSASTVFSPTTDIAPIGVVASQRREVSEKHSKQVSSRKVDSIITKFGNPNEALAVEGQDKAPLPFKGMLAALEAGQEDLARAYAKQYVRYISALKTKTDTAIKFIEAAEAEEKIAALPPKPPGVEDEE